jgi:segregation and condensation protein A
VDTNAVQEKYVVKAGSFEGPLEVLLGLIEERKLFINEISLASVTNEYLSYVRSLGGKNLPDATDFVVIAATLVLIKSRSLLPNLELTVDEKEKAIYPLRHMYLYVAMPITNRLQPVRTIVP